MTAGERPATVTLFVDPHSYHFERDRLFALETAQYGGADLLAPYIHLRRRLNELGVAVHTADLLDRGEGLSDTNVFVSLGMRDRYPRMAARDDVVLSAFFGVECPIVEPQLYAGLPAASAAFRRIFSYTTTEGLLPFTGTPVVLAPFRIPQSYDGVHDHLWGRGDRGFLVMINGNKLPRMDLHELYSERMRAVRFFDQRGEIDLFGVGWEGPPYRVGSPLPGPVQRVIRAGDFVRQAIRPDPLLAASQRAWRGRVDDKAQTLSGYRFAICFENMALDGWITEKLFDCLYSGTIPVYLGAPDITDWVPADCFIDMRRFAGYDELRDYLHALGEREIRDYREAARAFIASEAYAPFGREAFANLFIELLAADAGLDVSSVARI